MKKILSLVFIASLLVVPVTALAADIDGTALPDTTASSVNSAITKIGDILFGVLLLIALIYILLAAISFITAGGDPEKVKGAQNKILYALIGIGVAILAKGLIALIQSIITV
jgi:type IV secretion system pilin